MKKLLSFIALAAVLAATGCSRFSNRGEVENPIIDAANTPYLSFERVNLTDSSTELGAVIHFAPNNWIRFDSASVIVADGEEYPLLSIDGLQPGEKYFMPDSAVAHFTLRFPAVPSSAKTLDFDEKSEGGWKVLGIHLDKNYKYESEIPADKTGCAEDAVLPDVDMSRDTTIVSIHLLNYRPEMGSKLSYYVNDLVGQDSQVPALDVDADGNATFKKAVTGPAELVVMDLGGFPVHGAVLMQPGENIDLYVDCRYAGFYNMNVRDRLEYDSNFAYDGSNGELDRIERSGKKAGFFGFQLHSGTFADYHMNGDEYTDHVLNLYKSNLDSINASDAPAAAKELMTAGLQADVVYAISRAEDVLKHNYRFTYGTWGEKVPEDSVNIQISPENARRVAELIDLENPRMLCNYKVTSPDMLTDTRVWLSAGLDPKMLHTLGTYIRAYRDAASGKLDSADVDSLKASEYPAFAEAVLAKQKESEAVLTTAAAAMVEATPDVPADKVFDEIVKPYKGKVVVVDLWNTWCGPCRHALKENEPLKDGALSSDDIVWIYIADESSPMKTYLEMIPEIRGHHFHVSSEQIANIRDRFDVDGIPYYIIVDRQGKAEGRPDLRDHDLYVKTILDKLK